MTRTMRAMMTPSGFTLPPGTRLPDNWARVGTVDAGNRPVADLPFAAVSRPDLHSEKAYAVSTSIGGEDATMVGAGVEWTEDLKDQARRLHEDAVKYQAERQAAYEGRAQAKMEAFRARIDAKLAHWKRNPVTAKDPKHTKPKERSLF